MFQIVSRRAAHSMMGPRINQCCLHASVRVLQFMQANMSYNVRTYGRARCMFVFYVESSTVDGIAIV